MPKEWYLSRTIWIGVLEILIGCVGLVADFAAIGDYSTASSVLLFSGVLKVVLRYMTTKPLI